MSRRVKSTSNGTKMENVDDNRAASSSLKTENPTDDDPNVAEIVISNKGGPKLINRGYMYTLHKKQPHNIRWRCVGRTMHCRGSLITTTDCTKPRVRMEHNHKPDFAAAQVARKRYLALGKPRLLTDDEESKDSIGLREKITEQIDSPEVPRDYQPKMRVTSRKAGSTSLQEEHEDDEEDELHEATSASSTCSFAPNELRTRVTYVSKKKLHPVEKKILRALGMYEKRAKMDKRKDEDNENRHFLLSLVQSLESLPRHLNTACKIEIMQCINKYENMTQLHQQPLIYLPTTHQQHPGQQHRSQQPHNFQSGHHTRLCTSNQSESQHILPKTKHLITRPTLSPTELAASYTCNPIDENDLKATV